MTEDEWVERLSKSLAKAVEATYADPSEFTPDLIRGIRLNPADFADLTRLAPSGEVFSTFSPDPSVPPGKVEFELGTRFSIIEEPGIGFSPV